MTSAPARHGLNRPQAGSVSRHSIRARLHALIQPAEENRPVRVHTHSSQSAHCGPRAGCSMPPRCQENSRPSTR